VNGYSGLRTLSEHEVAELQHQVREAEVALFNREAELVDLRAELEAFSQEYEARIRCREAELEAVKAQIEAGNAMIQAHRARHVHRPSWQAGSGYVPVEEQYRQARQARPKPDFASSTTSPAEWVPPEEGGEAVDEGEIKRLYRELCRRFHPDLTQDEQERQYRTARMAAINVAYAERDLAALQAIAAEPDRPASDLGGWQLDALRDRLRQIERRMAAVEWEFQSLVQSELMQLQVEVKLARQRGHDLLAEMAAEIAGQLAHKRAELDLVTAQLRQLGLADG